MVPTLFSYGGKRFRSSGPIIRTESPKVSACTTAGYLYWSMNESLEIRSHPAWGLLFKLNQESLLYAGYVRELLLDLN
jgi:hypothetical protein